MIYFALVHALEQRFARAQLQPCRIASYLGLGRPILADATRLVLQVPLNEIMRQWHPHAFRMTHLRIVGVT
jgi:hypothetical protein